MSFFRVVTQVEVAEGGLIPAWYGLVFYRHYTRTAVYAPWGLHFLIGAWNYLKCRVRRWRFPDEWETHQHYWFEKGRLTGRKEGFDQAARLFQTAAQEKGRYFHVP